MNRKGSKLDNIYCTQMVLMILNCLHSKDGQQALPPARKCRAYQPSDSCGILLLSDLIRKQRNQPKPPKCPRSKRC